MNRHDISLLIRLLAFSTPNDLSKGYGQRCDTPLHVAAKDGHTEVVVRLLEAGADANVKNESGRTALQEAQTELAALEAEANPQTMTRQSRLRKMIESMEIAYKAAQ